MKPALSMLSLLIVLVSTPAATAQTKIRVNWAAVIGVMSGIWVAYDEGLFKKNGLDVELLHIPSTSRAIQSMLSGEIQLRLF
jgi:ABC-type nitrate/sulfonate/bicarbonate transport system substrate-binding protein